MPINVPVSFLAVICYFVIIYLMALLLSWFANLRNMSLSNYTILIYGALRVFFFFFLNTQGFLNIIFIVATPQCDIWSQSPVGARNGIQLLQPVRTECKLLWETSHSLSLWEQLHEILLLSVYV